MTELVDQPAAIRKGEELDGERLERYLLASIPSVSGPISIRQFPSGHSNLTYLVSIGDTQFVLRRPPFGSQVKSAHDMGREFKVLSKLSKVYPPAPRPALYCEDEGVVGAKFYLMERVQGLILRNRPPEGFAPSTAEVRVYCESLIDNLADLHSIDYEKAGLAELRKPGEYSERQVLGWSKRWEGSKTDEVPDIETILGWLNERIPKDTGAVVIHNDYKFDNVVLDPGDRTRIVAVLDWEMATVGDPLMDLGTSLAYWSEPADAEEIRVVQCFLTTSPGALTRMEIARRYGERTRRDTSNILYYYVFGLFKLAVIVQQIYYRYAQGLTKDERFAKMIGMVYALGRTGTAAIERGTVSEGL